MNQTSSWAEETSGLTYLLGHIGSGRPLSELSMPTSSTVCAIGGATLLGMVAWEQVKFRIKRQGKGKVLPGPRSAVPFLGGIVEMVRDPYGFWERQRLYATTGLSWNSIIGRFTVFVTDPTLVRHVFSFNSDDTLLLDLHPSSKHILGEGNIAFMHGPEHRALRSSFKPMFTRAALAVYVLKQPGRGKTCGPLSRANSLGFTARSSLDVGRRVGLCRAHRMASSRSTSRGGWRGGGEIGEIRDYVRELNAQTSQEVFSGVYLDDAEERVRFGRAYMAMTDAFLSVPICFPGTNVWKGRKGRLFIVEVGAALVVPPNPRTGGRARCPSQPSHGGPRSLSLPTLARGAALVVSPNPRTGGRARCPSQPSHGGPRSLSLPTLARGATLVVLTRAAARSKESMKAGNTPTCLLDFWTIQILLEMREAEEAGVPAPAYTTNHKMAYSVMDFLFASQDASTASLVWTMTQMAEHPEVLQKVRAEQQQLRPDLHAPITGDVLNSMVYTRQVVKEILRFRPPAPMVPQVAKQPFKLTDSYTAPKGSFIVPSIWAAAMHGYEDATRFDPDRFGPERQEDIKFANNFLVFGWGPHYCIGKEYAQNHLTVFLARIATTLDWTRIRSPVSDNILYLPTLYPADSVFNLTWRNKPQ
ncbi:MAG: hypothetical protein WDW38_003700 [Sanguina aurantia]